MPGAAVPRAECGSDRASPPAAILELSMRAAREVRESASPQALHASALIDLVWSDSAGIPLDRSISSLRTAARVSERPGAALADLAAAHLVRAGRRQSAQDLVEALDVAERAVEAEPGNAAALFNRALALEWLGVDAQAAGAWRAFLASDSTSDWAAEARRHLRAEPAPRAATKPPGPNAAPNEVEAYALGAPQEARVHGWNVVLGEWGSATLRGDARRAGEWLRHAEILGGALERRGGDATLADAVRAIRGATPAAVRVLAEGHRDYAAAQGSLRAEKAAAAAEALARVAALRHPSRALAGWAEHGRGVATALGEAGDNKRAEHLLDAMRTTVDTLRHPALAGQVYGALAGVRVRMARYQAAMEAAERAARHMERAREVEGVAGALYRKADAEYALGANAAAYETVHRALMLLRGTPTSPWRGGALASGSRVAMANGLERAALRFQDERVAVAERAGRPIHVAEARIARAEIRGGTGDEAGAADDVSAAAALIPRIASSDALQWIKADLRLALADAARRTAPRRALAMLDSALAQPEGPRPVMRRLRAHVARADTRLSLRDTRGASADLERVAGLLEDQRAEVASTHLRASLLDAARAVFDRVVMLRLAAGDTAGALASLEQGRASLLPRGAAAGGRSASLRVPPGRVGLSYALVGDTLLAWTVAGRDVRLTRTTVRSDSLARRIERAHSALEVRAREAALRPDLEALYDVLVRPVAALLGGEGTEVVIVADGEIAGVPFAALRDRVRNRYLVEDHPTRFAGTLADAGRAPAAGPGAGGVLLVADPAFDARAHPAVPRLPAAHAEVAALATLYPGARVLEGSAATPSALVRGLRGAGIVHFAGHATFDDTHPGRSSLVLAPDRAGGSLTADSLAELELRGVRLVVLSACQTLRARGGRSGGFAGFAAALGGAGAGGVLGSLWRVDDELTGPVMEAFHRRYRSHGDPSRALRDAQLQMLRSSNPALRAPAAWAGFRYAGA